MRKPLIAIIGAASPTDQQAAFAYDVGRLLGEQGVAIVTGGLSGVMEAASRGAREAGGLVIGILPGAAADTCNPHVEISVATGLGDGRNAVITNTADVFIAVGGGFGTLSEIAYALKRNKPVIGLDTWQLDASRMSDEPWWTVATPEEAAAAALAALAGHSSGRSSIRHDTALSLKAGR